MPQQFSGAAPSSFPAKTSSLKAVLDLVIVCLIFASSVVPATGDSSSAKRPHAHIPVPIHNKYVPPAPGDEKKSDPNQPDFAATRAFAAQEEYDIGSSSLLKVLNLNAWGLVWPWSKDRTYRFRALREIIAASDYDIILLQEVWFRQDYDTIRSSVPYVTFFESFNKACSGYFFPVECSGLMILSRHPIESVEFRPFSYRGSFWNFDGEIFVAKGVGRARIRWKGLKVDVFTSHFVSYTRDPNIDNSHYRFTQAMETRRYIEQSSADIKLFGGDMNALPLYGPNQPYGILRGIMNDTLTDMYPDASYHPWFSTFGNLQNSYTAEALPERIDYLLYRGQPELNMRTKKFVMPMFITRNSKHKLISLSDHEALHVEFLVDVKHYHEIKKRKLSLAGPEGDYQTSFSPSEVAAIEDDLERIFVKPPPSLYPRPATTSEPYRAVVNGTKLISIHADRRPSDSELGGNGL